MRPAADVRREQLHGRLIRLVPAAPQSGAQLVCRFGYEMPLRFDRFAEPDKQLIDFVEHRLQLARCTLDVDRAQVGR